VVLPYLEGRSTTRLVQTAGARRSTAPSAAADDDDDDHADHADDKETTR
jgi:hypothetical protein